MTAEAKVIETKRKIMDKARELFLTRGYQDTSINDIITKTGLSKGAFYHHFKSKEDLLDSLSALFIQQAFEDVLAITREDCNGLEKLNRIFDFSRQYKSTNKDMVRLYLEAMYSPSNLQLLEKIKKGYTERVSPILVGILEQGGREGFFDVTDPGETVAIAVDMMFGLSRANADFLLKKNVGEDDWAALDRLNNAYVRAIERLLGARPGTLKLQIGREFIGMFR
jgi:AcrR family transcriptional regulator